MTPYELKLAPLPGWEKLPAAAIRKKVAEAPSFCRSGETCKIGSPQGHDL